MNKCHIKQTREGGQTEIQRERKRKKTKRCTLIRVFKGTNIGAATNRQEEAVASSYFD